MSLSLGRDIEAVRTSIHLSRFDLAQILEVTVDDIMCWESDKNDPPIEEIDSVLELQQEFTSEIATRRDNQGHPWWTEDAEACWVETERPLSWWLAIRGWLAFAP